MRTKRPSPLASRRARRTGGMRSAGTRSSRASSPAPPTRSSRSTSSAWIASSGSSPGPPAIPRRRSSRPRRSSRCADALADVAGADAHGFQIEVLLQLAQHVVGDRALVPQAHEHPTFGAEHLGAQPAPPLRLAGVVLQQANAVAELVAQPLHVARVHPFLAREVF